MHQSRNQKNGTPDKDVAEDIKALCNRKYMSDFSHEMTRSAKEYLKKFQQK